MPKPMEHNADVDADDYMTTAKSGQRMVRATEGRAHGSGHTSVRWDEIQGYVRVSDLTMPQLQLELRTCKSY